jgi:hypothetical protein
LLFPYPFLLHTLCFHAFLPVWPSTCAHCAPDILAENSRNSSFHYEKLLNQTTGILPCSTREYEDTFPCRVLSKSLFLCMSLKNNKVVSTRECEIHPENSTCIDTTLEYSRVGTPFGIFPCRDQIRLYTGM